MSTTIRFHLDEHVGDAVAVGLRAQGIDVTTTRDAGLSGADDPDHLQFALAQRRVVMTHDDDFLKLAVAGHEHAGIAFCHSEKHSLRELLQMLLLVHACFTAEEMKGHIEFL